MNEMMISVGIPTEGEPRLEPAPDGLTRLRNMTIGLGFHWQRSVEALLPGVLVPNPADAGYPLINRLPLETYLECVVGSEMNPSAPAEFLKAHAVISRSWAMGKISGCHPDDESGKISTPDLLIDWEDTCDHHGFNVCSDDHCQRYQGIQPMAPEVLDAVRLTAGEVLVGPDGRLVDTRFSKSCGGRTEVFSTCWQDREEPCLVSREDPWCDLASLSAADRQAVLSAILKDYDMANGGGYSWEATVSARDIESRLKEKFGRSIGRIVGIEVTGRGASGRAKRLRLDGTEGSLEIGKELMIRRLLASTHLYSSWIDIEPESARVRPMTAAGSGNRHLADDNLDVAEETDLHFRLHGRGWGHGVGLCQIGAARMALAGHSYADILRFYYPGSRLTVQS